MKGQVFLPLSPSSFCTTTTLQSLSLPLSPPRALATGMAEDSSLADYFDNERSLLDQLLPTLTEEDLLQYRDEVRQSLTLALWPPQLPVLGLIFEQVIGDSPLRVIARVDNPQEWVIADRLALWLVERLQTRPSPVTPRTPGGRLRDVSQVGVATPSMYRGRSRTPYTPSALSRSTTRSLSRSSAASSVPESVLSTGLSQTPLSARSRKLLARLLQGRFCVLIHTV